MKDIQLDKVGYVYSLSSSENEEVVKYIGYTTQKYGKRLSKHICESKKLKTKKDKWIQNVIKNGYKIVEEILYESDNIKKLKLNEIRFISLFKSVGANLKNGTDGGEGTHGLKNISISKFNKETKSKRIYFFDYKTGEFLHEFESVTESVKVLGLNHSSIGYILSGERFFCNRYWCSTKLFNPPPFPIKKVWNKGIKNSTNNKSVSLIKDELEIIFKSMREAHEYLNITYWYLKDAIINNKIINGYQVLKK